MAVDIDYIRKVKVVNFYSGLTPLVALYDDRLGVARVYERSVWEGRSPALFVWQDGVLRDVQTRSEWDMDGRCVKGNLEGASMEQLFGIYAFWFAWRLSTLKRNWCRPHGSARQRLGGGRRRDFEVKTARRRTGESCPTPPPKAAVSRR